MAIWQGKSKRKVTGGRYRPFRGKKRFEIGRERQFTHVGDESYKLYRTKGANVKVRLLEAEFANVMDRANNTMKRAKILNVTDNSANPNYVQRNILNKGAIIETDVGTAIVTSRPGQDGVVNAILK